MKDCIETITYNRTEAKIKLIKGQRSSFGWEITLPKRDGATNDSWIEELMHLNELLQEQIDNLNKMEEQK